MKEKTIAIIGLGYVGLPLAVEFGKKYSTIGYDLNKQRVNQLKQNIDSTNEITTNEIKEAIKLSFSIQEQTLQNAQIYIITVPTPVNNSKKPDLISLDKASRTIAKYLAKDDIVIYESTVYPGTVEEYCVPILEEVSKLKFNQDFFAGYSPERINPGDKTRRLGDIIKVTSGSTNQIAEKIDLLYKSIIPAGTYKAPSIKVAEAAKVIENTQRDINIALINELAMVFDQLQIDTKEVLETAGTKWNFLNFVPGIVGGHCIGVDPYYIAYKAEQVGYHPKLILAGRRINDNMTNFICSSVIKLMLKKKIQLNQSRVLILGFTFKENCPDIRNTKVINLINELKEYNVCIDVYDPKANIKEVQDTYGITLITQPSQHTYDAIILATKHQEFINWGAEYIRENFAKEKNIFYDIKSIFPKNLVDGRL